MKLAKPYAASLERIARKVMWFEEPVKALEDLGTFLPNLMVYGSAADVKVVEGFVGPDEFRKVLEEAPAGVFTLEVWDRWHERFGLSKRPLPRRRFPDGSEGPEAGGFFGR